MGSPIIARKSDEVFFSATLEEIELLMDSLDIFRQSGGITDGTQSVMITKMQTVFSQARSVLREAKKIDEEGKDEVS